MFTTSLGFVGEPSNAYGPTNRPWRGVCRRSHALSEMECADVSRLVVLIIDVRAARSGITCATKQRGAIRGIDAIAVQTRAGHTSMDGGACARPNESRHRPVTFAEFTRHPPRWKIVSRRCLDAGHPGLCDGPADQYLSPLLHRGLYGTAANQVRYPSPASLRGWCPFRGFVTGRRTVPTPVPGGAAGPFIYLFPA